MNLRLRFWLCAAAASALGGLAPVRAEPDGGRIFVQCSIEDPNGGRIYRAPVFEVEADAYDSDLGEWRRGVYSEALLESVKGELKPGASTFQGCFAAQRVTSTPLEELVEPYRAADDKGFEAVAAFAESDQLGHFAEVFAKPPAVKSVDWSPQAEDKAAGIRQRAVRAAAAGTGDVRLTGFIYCRYDVHQGKLTRSYFSGVMPMPVRLKHPTSYWTVEDDVEYPPLGIVYDWFASSLERDTIDTDTWKSIQADWPTNIRAKPALKMCRTASNRLEAAQGLADAVAIAKRKPTQVFATGWTLSSEDYASILAPQ